ncbi:MAG: hypothetical protein NC217_03185 [Muribaculaceae bacterium]|nr:hypothetical protein [Muribaculaceae bacterium]
MKILTHIGATRLVMALVCLLGTFGLTAQAQQTNKLYINDFNLSGATTTRVAIELDNTPDLAGLQFNVNLPEGWKIAGVERNSERLSIGQNLSYNSKGLFLVTSGSRNTFVGTSGTLAWLEIEASAADIANGADATITLSDIVYSTAQGTRLPGETSTVTNVSVQSGSGILSTLEQEMVMNPGATRNVEVSLANDFDVRGLQMEIVVPQGFSILGDQINITNRVSNGSAVNVTKRADGVTYGVVIVDYNGNNIIPTGQGEIFSFTLVAASDFEADNATLSLQGFEMSNSNNKTIYGEGCTVNIINGKGAHQAALAVVDALQQKLDNTLQTIKTDCPLVADNYDGAELQGRIDALREAIEKAYEEHTLTADYENVLAPSAGISTDIDTYLSNAQAAQNAEVQRRADNKAAYDAVVALLDGLQQQLDTVKQQIADTYPAYRDEAAEKAAQDAIDALRTQAEQAYEAVAEDGRYEYNPDTAAVEAQINALLTDAQAKAAEADRQTANKNAWEADLQKLAGLQAQLDAAKAEIAEKYADFADPAAEKAAQDAIDALTQAVNKAYEAVANKGNYDYTLDTTAVEAQIASLVPDAAARAKAEADRQAANKAAWEADLQKLADLQAQLDAAKAEIAEKYADFADPAAEKAAQDAIDALTQAVNKAYEAVANEGNYDYTLDITAVEAQIASLVPDAAARANESARQAANKAAWEADLQKLAGLQAQLDAAKAEVREKYNGFQDTNSENYIQTQIDMMKLAATNAYNAVATAGTYSYDLNTTALEERISELVPAAAEAYRQDLNDKAYDTDLKLIDKLENEFNAALLTVQTLYPEFIDSEYVSNMRQQLQATIDACNKEYEDVEQEGLYESQVDYDTLSAAIKKMLEEIKASGISTVLNDVDLSNAEIYTVDGQRHNAPVRGQMNIIRLSDGSVVKVMVK